MMGLSAVGGGGGDDGDVGGRGWGGGGWAMVGTEAGVGAPASRGSRVVRVTRRRGDGFAGGDGDRRTGSPSKASESSEYSIGTDPEILRRILPPPAPGADGTDLYLPNRSRADGTDPPIRPSASTDPFQLFCTFVGDNYVVQDAST
ncbi:hypothetical protein DM860_016790 [Cuscuta australis]|uniref:Uncharacterized protein n=1 Tax=Cuscuta australis TaxID=267555 RepID=A0A328DWA3_9ASTE|nr:hypothetical protein DM860_016790 [Cuscuta australis]